MRSVVPVGIVTTALALGLQAPASAEEGAEYLWTAGGYGLWQADPYLGDPGDSIKACDAASDGWAVAVSLSYEAEYREVTTRGHPSGYCSTWLSGNIPEGTKVTIRVWEVKSDGNGGVRTRDTVTFIRTA